MLGLALHLLRCQSTRNAVWGEVLRESPPTPERLKRMRQLATFAAVGAYPHVILRGFPLSAHERQSIALFGAATALADDLTDVQKLDLARMLALARNEVNPENELEIQTHKLFQAGLDLHPRKDVFLEVLNRVLRAQDTSKQQESEISLEESWNIAKEKGAAANLLFLYFMHHEPSKEEVHLAEITGEALQLLDDIFDLYEDLQAGINTPVICSGSIKKLREMYRDALEKLNQSLKTLPVSAHKQSQAAKHWRFIFKRGFIALDQFELFCKKTNQAFPPTSYTRPDLIVDMEKPGNIWRNVFGMGEVGVGK
jgi:hypothetical protein